MCDCVCVYVLVTSYVPQVYAVAFHELLQHLPTSSNRGLKSAVFFGDTGQGSLSRSLNMTMNVRACTTQIHANTRTHTRRQAHTDRLARVYISYVNGESRHAHPVLAAPPPWRSSGHDKIRCHGRKASGSMVHPLLCAHACWIICARGVIGYATCSLCVCAYVRAFVCVCVPQAQKRAMDAFRQGDTNLLLATHVGAEGLDFGCCSRVVLLDVPSHVVQLTQVRAHMCRMHAKTVTMGMLLLSYVHYTLHLFSSFSKAASHSRLLDGWETGHIVRTDIANALLREMDLSSLPICVHCTFSLHASACVFTQMP